MSIVLLLVSVSVLVLGAALCAIAGRRSPWANRLGGAVAVAGAVPAVLLAGCALWTGETQRLRMPWAVPFGSFSIAVDGLSAFFILAIAVICSLAAIYGGSYMRHYTGRKNLGLSWFFYNMLFASMLLVVTARNGVLFLVAWEVMSLASFFLVMFEHEKEEVREAGWTYLAATHLGTCFLFALFLLLSWQGQTMDFDSFAVPSGVVSAGTLFLFAVIGFGTKAGLMPMHVWLPEAHPAAPSHVSAVMSGVMIKTGIYGLLRILTFLGEPSAWPAWWGWTLIGFGVASGVGGVLFALAQRDIKRLLAYSSVENIGIICLGLGLYLLGSSAGQPSLAALGLLGALLHTWNHAVFKSLLFLAAGAVVHATGTRDIELLGGVLKRMRHVGLAFVVGSAAICGLPPLNGFLGEFVIYLGAFAGVTGGAVSAAAASLLVVAALALIGGLAIACFTKVSGIVFLGEARSDLAKHAHEAPALMRVPLAILAGLCIVIGLLGPLLIPTVEPAAQGLMPEPAAHGSVGGTDLVPLLWRIDTALMLLLVFVIGLWALRRRLLAHRTVEEAGTWDCGYASPTARMQYTASSFGWPILDMFRSLLRPRVVLRRPSGLLPGQASLESRTEDVFRRYGYGPVFRSVGRVADRLRWVQQGRNQLYVLYIALTLLALLLWKLGISR